MKAFAWEFSTMRLGQQKVVGAGGTPKFAIVGPRPFNWLSQDAVVFEISNEMSSPDILIGASLLVATKKLIKSF